MESPRMEDLSKMSGYLSKRGKMKMIGSWKKYWFVLEGSLLLFYRSKEDYHTSISPCKGSINLGPPCMVKPYPGTNFAFQIETRANTITLKANSLETQTHWMKAIMCALHQNQNVSIQKPLQLNHFRYSLDDLVPKSEPKDPPYTFQRQNTMPHRRQWRNSIIDRLQKMGAHNFTGDLERAVAKKATTDPFYQEVHKTSRDNIYDNVVENRVQSILIDNETYSVPMKKCCSTQNVSNKVQCRVEKCRSVMIENDHYNKVEEIYTEPMRDQNKNFTKRNSVYMSADEVLSERNMYEEIDPINNKPKNETSLKTKEVKKGPSFLRKLWKKKEKQPEQQEEEELYQEISPIAVEKIEITPDSTKQMLSELHNILEHKKITIQKCFPDGFTTSNPDIVPTLPPKTHKLSPSLGQEQVRSLDEILEDLDRETIEPKNKVQLLIEKFSEPEVILRNKPEFRIDRNSDDLDRLLEELAKVTAAPIMPPGATSSLINPDLPKEEWIKMLPIRRRRLSEPDYDIPRPHKAIPTLAKDENDAIPATRFFGPVLPSKNEEDSSACVSMTPDSLEMDPDKSYFSHQYSESDLAKDLKCFSNYSDDKIIYALPKSYSVATHIVNTCQNICSAVLAEEHTIIYKNVRNNDSDEVFSDSLELFNESLTEF